MTDRARAELPGNTEVLVQWGAWLFRYRSYVLLPLAAFLALEAGLSPPRIGGASLEVARAMGLVLVALGAAVRIHVAGRAKAGTSGRGCHFRAAELVTSGLYGRTRNPLYLGNLLIWAGMALVTCHPALLPLCLAVVGFHYYLIIIAEEQFLRHCHGAKYQRYVASVPRLLPSLWRSYRVARLSQVRQGLTRFSWKRALLREHDTLFAMFAGAWLLITLASTGGPTPRGGANSLTRGIAIPVIAVAGWLVLKTLRKANRWGRRRPAI